MSNSRSVPAPKPLSTWEKHLLGTSIGEIHLLLPGLIASALLASASVWLCSQIGGRILGLKRSPISAVTMAILLGLVVGNLVRLPRLLRPGLTFAVKKVLRLGIILLGIRLSILDVLELGITGVPVVLACIIGALFLSTRLNRWLKLPERLGTLIAVGTSICGVSAIVATGPAIDAEDEEVAYAVTVITVFGVIATLAYPYVARALFPGDAVSAGLFLGTAIHDTSQVTGAALIFSDVFSLPRALDVATVTKLVRNVFMAAVIPFVAYRYACSRARADGGPNQRPGVRQLLPLFVVGFLVCAALRSVGDAGIRAGGYAFGLWSGATWQGIHSFIKTLASDLLVVALAAVGLNTRFEVLKGLGIKPFLVGLGAAVGVGGISVLCISLLRVLVPG